MFGMLPIDIVVIVLYFGSILWIGYKSMKRIKNQEDFFLGALSASGETKAGAGGKPSIIYILASDLGEKRNRIDSDPAVAEKMRGLLEQAVVQGRTTPGPKQSNDVPVTIRISEQHKPKTKRKAP